MVKRKRGNGRKSGSGSGSSSRVKSDYIVSSKKFDNYESGCLEENTMVMLDTSFSATDQHKHDDRLAFLDAVRAATLVPEKATAPTKKMLGKILQLLREEESLDLMVRIYQLLNELKKRYPRVYLSKVEKSGISSPDVFSELVLDEKAWLPFSGLDVGEEANKKSGVLIDPFDFHSLIKDIAERNGKKNCLTPSTKSLQKCLLFQYLVDVIEDDFSPRNYVFNENMNWTVLRESILNMLLASRKITYKVFVKDCMYSMCDFCHDAIEIMDNSNITRDPSVEPISACEGAAELLLPGVEKTTCVSLKKLILMIMELDSSRSVANVNGLITRFDGVRTPAREIIIDELAYNNGLLPTFFSVFDDYKQKLDLIVQYFYKYIPQTSVRTRRSSGGSESEMTFDGLLKFLSNGTNVKGLVRKMGKEAAQLLLAHVFQAYISLPQDIAKKDSSNEEDGEDTCLVETCKNIIIAFKSIRGEDKNSENDFWCREALFTAATIISMKSKGTQ